MNRFSSTLAIFVAAMLMTACTSNQTGGHHVGVFSGLVEDSNGWASEERVIVGSSVDTPELHNVRYTSGCEKVGDGKWCFKVTRLEVKAPNSKWVFVGAPYVEVTRDNQGSAQWNAIGASDRFRIVESNPDRIVAEIKTGSRSIGVRLCCNARYYP